jgi:hypothetical protein
MGQPLRILWTTAALVAVAVLAALVRPEWSRDLGLPRDRLAEVANDLAGGPVPSMSAEDRERFVARYEAKKRVTRVLLERRLTLFEAAALFRRVSERWPLPSDSPSESTGEDFCRQAITWATSVGVRRSLGLDGDERVEAPGPCEERLLTELRCHRAMHGVVVLSDAPDVEGYLTPAP